MPLPNGHLSPLASNVMNVDDPARFSDSELSDAKEVAPIQPLSSDSASPVMEDEDAEQDVQMTSPSSQDEDAEGSEDGDYSAEIPAVPQSDDARADRSSTEQSQRPAKRKASVDDDEHMQMNPELYGLRRSVSGSFNIN